MTKPLIFGLVGHPVSQSLSPRLHEAAFVFSGFKGEYRLFDITASELETRIADLVAAGLAGFNVTIPHKQALFRMVTSRSPEAERVGALNAVKVMEGGRMAGHNTDYQGLKSALEQSHKADFGGKNALLLGAGGAALAAAQVACDLGFANLRVLARDPERQTTFIEFVKERRPADAQSWARSKPITIEPDRKEYWREISLIINATSLGLTDEAPPSWMTELVACVPDDCFCFDMVYRKDNTLPTFARLAQARGLKATAGIDMLIHQARLSFEYWTGVAVPFEQMKKALD